MLCVMCKSKADEEVCLRCQEGIQERIKEAQERVRKAPPKVVGPKYVTPSMKLFRRGFTVKGETE